MTVQLTDEPIVAYALNGLALCLNCVKRFDLTNPKEHDGDDLFEPLTAKDVQHQPDLVCGVPVCRALITPKASI